MTRVLVQRGSSGSSSSNQNRSSTLVPVSAPAPSSQSGSSSSNQNRSSTSVPVSAPAPSSSSASSDLSQHKDSDSVQVVPAVTDENLVEEVQDWVSMNELSESSCVLNGKGNENQSEDLSPGSVNSDQLENVKIVDDKVLLEDDVGKDSLRSVLAVIEEENDETVGSSFQMVNNSSCPPPPPPIPSPMNSNSWRFAYNDSNAMRIGSPRRAAGWSGVSSRSSPNGSRPSSPRSHGEGEGYNSADEHNPCFSSSYDAEREHQFEIDLRRVKGLDVRKMQEDGNCLFRAVADQVYGDSEVYDLVRQMCINYMERERDHFSQFVTEGFTSYCKRKRRDKVYGNNLEIQAMSEMYNRPIHIYSYSAEPFNIFHGSYNTDTPPIRISYLHGNHYNSLVDPRQLTIGAGLGFSSLKGRNVDKDQVKAAIKAQQDQQIDSAFLSEGRFYSDLELTEKEIERMVMEASRAEYLADDKFKQQLGHTESLTSKAEPSSSAARSSSGSDLKQKAGLEISSSSSVLNDSMQIMLSMGFNYLQVIEANNIFGDDVDSMVGYLLDTSSGGRRKGKATE